MRHLELLITAAEDIPVALDEQVARLRGEVGKAREWVKRVRESLPPKRSSRARGGEPDKPELGNLKELLDEGAARGENDQTQHLAAVVESAEDWQQRVREALAEGSGESSETLKALKSLLDEADDLPVCMAEAGLLAEELQQRQWTVEARALLDAGAPHAKLAVLKRKLGEADEIREIRDERLEKKKRAAGVVGVGWHGNVRSPPTIRFAGEPSGS